VAKNSDKKTYCDIEFEIRTKSMGRFEWEFTPPKDTDPDECTGTVNGSRNKAVDECKAAIDAWLEKNP
jgi:hypothetical protein